MNFELVELSKLNPAKYNPRTIDDRQLTGLKESIKKFGFIDPVIVNKKNNVIVGGHQRCKVAEMLSMDKVPVSWVDLSLSEEKALNVALNSHTISGDYDKDILPDLLKEIKDDLPDLFNDLNFDDFDVELPEIETLDPQSDEDEVPEVENPITKRGDIWLLGKHRLMCGDSTMIDDVEKLMNGEKADMVFTDPPYGVNYQSNMRTKSEKFDVLKNDDEFLDIVPIIDSYSRGFVFIWSTWKVIGEWLDKTKALGKPSNTIVWFKGGGGIGDLKKTFSTDWELALVWHRGKELTGKRIGSVWSIGKDKAIDYKHPTQKPVELAEEALDKCSKNGYRILDLFGGSGSTLIACEKMNRLSLNMELDETYCDVIINRWQNYTGKKAVLESTGEQYDDLKKVAE